MLLLASYYHDLNPVAIPIAGDFAVRWYGLAYLAGFLVAYLILRALSRRGLVLIPPHRVPDAMLWLIGAILVGGRAAYVLIYDRSLLTTFSDGFPYWNALAINKGGMASHGGMVGLAFACWRISRGWREPDGSISGRCPTPHVMDAGAFIAPPGLFFGRLANFVNGELLGKIHTPPGADGPWWTVKFPQELLREENITDPPPGARELVGRVAHELAPMHPGLSYRDVAEFIVARPAQFRAQLEPILSSRHPSQIYQAVAEGLVLGAVLLIVWARPRKPGVVGATFLIVYGLLRILTEFWRLPDDQFTDGRPYGLSRGQWLSALMVAAGIGMLTWAARRAAPKLGGWLTAPKRSGA